MKKKFDGFVRKFCKTKTFSIFVVQTSPKKFSDTSSNPSTAVESLLENFL
jgi:hypothetical protein